MRSHYLSGIIFVLSISAVVKAEVTTQVIKQDAQIKVFAMGGNFSYIADRKTNLCFFQVARPAGEFTITLVSCDAIKKVEAIKTFFDQKTVGK